MGNEYRYTPLFFLRIFFYFYFLTNTHEYAKKNKKTRKLAYQHIE